jgi:hypothetical protein
MVSWVLLRQILDPKSSRHYRRAGAGWDPGATTEAVKMTKTYRSEAFAAIHETMEALHDVGADDARVRRRLPHARAHPDTRGSNGKPRTRAGSAEDTATKVFAPPDSWFCRA